MNSEKKVKWQDIVLICFLGCILAMIAIVILTFQSVIVVSFALVFMSIVIYGIYKAACWIFNIDRS